VTTYQVHVYEPGNVRWWRSGSTSHCRQCSMAARTVSTKTTDAMSALVVLHSVTFYSRTSAHLTNMTSDLNIIVNLHMKFAAFT